MTENTPSIDLYGLLGVDRVASPQTIREAFRAQSKVLHPDVPGGDKLKFNQIRLARDILLNPKSRANYDSVGVIDQDQADNAQAELLAALTGQFGAIMYSLLKHGQDPSRGDFVMAMQDSIKQGFEQTNKTINQLEKSLAVVKMLDGRFKVRNLENPNLMQMIVEGQINQVSIQIQQARAQIRQLEMARIALTDVVFEQAA